MAIANDAFQVPALELVASLDAKQPELELALDALVAGKPAPEDQTPSLGCNIKWKAANEPDYFDPAGVS